MSRTPQPEGLRGSLKWIQRAVACKADGLERPILAGIASARTIDWRSPVASDDFAEYRDADFLRLVGLDQLTEALRAFWPERGPQWDALGVTDAGDVLLVEAKAHIAEMCSPGTTAGPISRARIAQRLDEVAADLGAPSLRAPWTEHFYQLANRLAHLAFLRGQGVQAYLVLVGFLGDRDMGGPAHAESWEAAYTVALHAMGLRRRHRLTPAILHAYPDVATLQD